MHNLPVQVEGLEAAQAPVIAEASGAEAASSARTQPAVQQADQHPTHFDGSAMLDENTSSPFGAQGQPNSSAGGESSNGVPVDGRPGSAGL